MSGIYCGNKELQFLVASVNRGVFLIHATLLEWAGVGAVQHLHLAEGAVSLSSRTCQGRKRTAG